MSKYFSDDDKRDLKAWLQASDTRGLRPPQAYVLHELARRLSIPPWEVADALPEIVEAELAMMQVEADAQRYWKAKASRPSSYNLNITTQAPYEPIVTGFQTLEEITRGERRYP